MSNDGAANVRYNVYWNTLLRIPTRAISFIISIVVARILVPRDFGIMAVVMMLIGYANMFTNLGFSQAIVQKNINNPKTLGSIFTVDLCLSSFLALSFFLISDYLANFFNTPESGKVIRVMSVVFVITSFYAISHGILRRDMRFRTFAILETSHSLLMSTVTLVLAALGYGYWALAFGQLVPLALMSIIFCICARWAPTLTYKHKKMMEIYDFGLWSFVRNQINFLSQTIDKVIIGRWLGPVNLGFYDKAKSISGIPADSILVNINAVLFSSFSKIKENQEVLKNDFSKALSLNSVIIFPLYFGLMVIAPYFVHTLLGQKWSPMIKPFQLILLGFLIRSFTILTSTFNVAVGNYKRHSIRVGCSTAVFLILALVLVKFGLNAVCWSFIGFSSVLFILDYQLIVSHTKVTWWEYIRPIMVGLVPSLIMLICIKVLARLTFSEYSIGNLVSLTLGGFLIYTIYLFLTNDRYILEIRQKVISDLFSKIRGK